MPTPACSIVLSRLLVAMNMTIRKISSDTPTVRPDIATTILVLIGMPCVLGRAIVRVGLAPPAGPGCFWAAPEGSPPPPGGGGGGRAGGIAPADVVLGPLATGTWPVDLRAAAGGGGVIMRRLVPDFGGGCVPSGLGLVAI